jgi:nitrous oxide reductase accessory protein NosL
MAILATGCTGLVVQPVEVEHTQVTTTDWTEDVGPWFSIDTPLQKYEIGLRSDGVMVWRTAQPAQDEAEATRQWREYEAKAFEQAEIDRGVKYQGLYE